MRRLYLGITIIVIFCSSQVSSLVSYSLTNVALLRFIYTLSSEAQFIQQDLYVTEYTLRRALVWDAQNKRASRNLGLLLVKLDREAEGVEIWQNVNNAFDEFILFGDLARQKGEYEQALTWYQLAVELKPDFGDLWYYIGAVYEGAGEKRLALQAYQISLSATVPLSIRVYVDLGAALDRLGQREQALLSYQKAVDLSCQVQGKSRDAQWERVWPLQALGGFYVKYDEFVKAEQAFQEALERDVNEIWVSWPLWGLGRIALYSEKHKEAIDYFLDALDKSRSSYLNSQIYFGIAQSNIQRGNLIEGVDFLRKANNEYSANKGLRRYLVDTLLDAGYYREAIQECESYLQLWPRDQYIIRKRQDAMNALHSD